MCISLPTAQGGRGMAPDGWGVGGGFYERSGGRGGGVGSCEDVDPCLHGQFVCDHLEDLAEGGGAGSCGHPAGE